MNISRNSEYKQRNLDFIKEYSQQEGVVELHNGVCYRILTKGGGAKPLAKSFVKVHYSGRLINGKTFDSTPKGKPAIFKLAELIEGWRCVLRDMPAGSKWEIVIPFNLGYGAKGSGNIKGFSTLIFEIHLLDIK